tara:strand:- start:3734 stop:5812 length:2079 start_codon:yes stop_codon:yes gene_type:complete
MIDWAVTFAPVIPWWIIGTLGVVCVFGIGLALFKGLGGWWLRALAGISLLLALANPMISQQERNALSNIVFVVLDNSESMGISDRPAQITTALNGIKSRFADDAKFEIREVSVTNDLDVRDSGSMVMTALSQAAAQVAASRIAGAIVISDGRIHDADMLRDFPAPVHLLQAGRADDWDKRLELINAPSFAIVGEEITLRLRINEDGAVPADKTGRATLNIVIDGDEYGTFPLPTNRELELPLKLSHGGINVVQFNVLPEDGELTTRNNNAVLQINGVRDRLRVLLVSGEPYTGERTWRNLLKSDSAVDLVHFTILRPPNKMDGASASELSLIAFPVRQLFLDKIDEFDLIIFDRYKRRGMLSGQYLSNVVQYVRNGGAVLVAAGENFAGAESLFRTELRDILPAVPTSRVIEQGYKPRVTDLGNKHPVTEGLQVTDSDDAPDWGRWFRLIEAEQISGDVVMTGAQDKPLLILDRVEKGRVALLLSDQAWMWSRGFEGGGPQLELLRRLAHWSMQEPDLEEEKLSVRVDGTEVIVTRRSLRDEPRALQVEKPDGTTMTVEMNQMSDGKWQGKFSGQENGLYRLSDGDQSAVVALGPTLPREFEQVIATDLEMAQIIDQTGGGVIALDRVPSPSVRISRSGRVAGGDNWIGVVDRAAFVVTAVKQMPVIPAWLYLLLAAGFAVLAWWREGRRAS